VLRWGVQDHLERVRSEVLTAERALLYTVCFQLRIQTPYTTVLGLIKEKDGQDVTNLTQVAWNLVNDR
jgi:cyclin T